MTQHNLRTRRLFRDNDRALVVAIDHPRVFDTITGLKDANTVIKAVLDAGADAILAPHGTASRAANVLGNGGLWMSVDTTPQTVAPIVESALRLGVNGIKVEMFPWCSPENDFFTC